MVYDWLEIRQEITNLIDKLAAGSNKCSLPICRWARSFTNSWGSASSNKDVCFRLRRFRHSKCQIAARLEKNSSTHLVLLSAAATATIWNSSAPCIDPVLINRIVLCDWSRYVYVSIRTHGKLALEELVLGWNLVIFVHVKNSSCGPPHVQHVLEYIIM